MQHKMNRANSKDGRIAITAANMADLPENLSNAGLVLAKKYNARRFMVVNIRSEKAFRQGLGTTFDAIEYVDGGAVAIGTDSGNCTATTRGCAYLYIYLFV